MRLSPFLFYCSSRVILLQSGDIFRNLAFEAALFTDNERFHTQDRSRTAPTDILMWRSDPCVVIGRFQNAWKECNLDILRANQWLLARRQSGGGSVFHDRDNLNVSFMQARSVLNRRNCMEFLQSVLQRLVPAKKIIIGDRFDLWQADPGENGLASAKRKISGSASRLGAKVAYHHCTLLCETNLNNLSEVLSPTFKTLRSKSTDSVRSPVANIGLSVEELERSIIDDSLEWLIKIRESAHTPLVCRVPEGEEPMHVNSERFHNFLSEFQSWAWIYGASPAFELDLSEFETSLTNLGCVRLHCSAGGRVQSVQIQSNLKLPENFLAFLHGLCEALTKMECRAGNWHGPLDQFCSKWLMQHGSDSWSNDCESIIRALRLLTDHL